MEMNSFGIKTFIILVIMLVSCKAIGYAQNITDPVFERLGYEVIHPHIDRVEITKDSTKVYCSINYPEGWSYSIPKTMSIEDINERKKYQISKCIGLPFEPEKKEFKYGGKSQFIFCFPRIDGLKKFNLIEDSSKDAFFNIYGVNLLDCYPVSFEESEYMRFKNMSDFYRLSGDLTKYVDFREKELSASQYIFGTRSLAAELCNLQLARYYNEVGDYSKAIHFGLEALECDSIQFGIENKEYPVYANTLSSLSQFYINADKEMESLQCIIKCIKIRRNIGDAEGYLNELFNLLSTGHNSEEILKSIAIAKKELDSLPDFIEVNSMPVTRIYKQIALKYYLTGEYHKAIEYCNKAISVMKINGQTNCEDYAELLGLICKFQQRYGQKEDAVVSGEKSKQLYESLNSRSLKYVELLEDLAWAYGKNLDYEKSIQLQQTACSIHEESRDWLSLASGYGNLSHFFLYKADLNNAEKYIRKAIETMNIIDTDSIIKKNIETTGKPSIGYYHTEYITRNIEESKSNLYQELAVILQKQDKMDEAINAEKANGLIIKSMNNDIMDSTLKYAWHLVSLSSYYYLNKQINDAINYAEQSIQILSNKNQKIPAFMKMNLGMLHFWDGDKDKAVQYLTEAISLSEVTSDNNVKIQALEGLSTIYIDKQDFEKAEKYLSTALDLQKDSILQIITEMTTEQKQRLWAEYEFSFLLYRSVIEKFDRNDDYLSKLYDYILFSKSLLLDTEIQWGTDKLERLNVKWKDIQKQLTEEDIAIEFISSAKEGTYHALVIDKNSPNPKMITLNGLKLEETRNIDAHNVCDIVNERIWNPILTQFKTIKNIYFSPDGILHILPIEHYGTDTNKNTSEPNKIFRVSSTKELIKKQSIHHYNSAVLYGGLDYNQLNESPSKQPITKNSDIIRGIKERGGFEPLHNTLTETQEIEALLKKNSISTDLFSGKNGTEESFRCLSNQNVNIIHIATHGMYVSPNDIDTRRLESNFKFLESVNNENDPVKEDQTLTHSFLVMSGGNSLIQHKDVTDQDNDGILTAKDISQVKFTGLDLVVLSACESALGDLGNEGIYGLQRGFKKAGANTILMSLGKVDDEATKILMVEFYKNLMNGKSKQQSLRDAQKYLRSVENRKYDKTQYWASFIMLDGLD